MSRTIPSVQPMKCKCGIALPSTKFHQQTLITDNVTVRDSCFDDRRYILLLLVDRSNSSR